MERDEALGILGIETQTPRSTARAIFKARVLPLYPNGYAPAETRNEFEQLTEAWQTVASLLPRNVIGACAVGAAMIYDAETMLHALERPQQELDIRL